MRSPLIREVRGRGLLIGIELKQRVQPYLEALCDRGILAVGRAFPVVPRGDDTIRFQINAAHTATDIDDVLTALRELR